MHTLHAAGPGLISGTVWSPKQGASPQAQQGVAQIPKPKQW